MLTLHAASVLYHPKITEEQMEQDKKKVQSMAEVMKNPTKTVLLQVCLRTYWTGLVCFYVVIYQSGYIIFV